MLVIAFVGALALSLVAFEVANVLVSGSTVSRGRLLSATDFTRPETPTGLNTWQALVAALWPTRFHPAQAATRRNVVERLRRAGYPFATTGEFYAYAVRTFAIHAVAGILMAGALVANGGNILIAVGIFLLLTWYGLRKPYRRLDRAVKERSEAMKFNMLPILASVHAYLRAGLGVQDALRSAWQLGGPFGNMLGFLLARMEIEPFPRALQNTKEHYPDPEDVIASRFFDAIEAYFMRNRPMLETVEALLDDLRDEHADAAAERVALTKRQAGLFGVLAVAGLVISLIWPALGG